jgi:hypothetical protein
MSDQPVQKYSFREFLSKADKSPNAGDGQYEKSYIGVGISLLPLFLL